MTKLILGIAAAAALSAQGAPATKEKTDLTKLPPVAQVSGVTYGGHVQKIFEASCVKCHGPEKSKGRLRLDTLEGAMKGGESGKVIAPGKSAESPLVHNITYLGDEDHHMPPPGNKAGIQRLTSEEIGLIRAWIDQGAK